MGTYEDKCPTMVAVGVKREDVEAAVAAKAEAIIVAEPKAVGLTKEQAEECLQHFIYHRSQQFPTDKTQYAVWSYAEVAVKLGITPEQVEQLHKEFVAYKDAPKEEAVVGQVPILKDDPGLKEPVLGEPVLDGGVK